MLGVWNLACLVFLLQCKHGLSLSEEVPTNVEAPPADLLENNNSLEIPLELMQEINDVANISDFFARFVENGAEISNRMGEEDNVERNIAVIPKNANCIPVDAEVSLKPDGPISTTTIYFPSCTRVKRCSGCCNNKLISCQATESETLSFKILQNEYHSATGKFKNVGYPIVFVEQHTKCQCMCRVKESDCNRLQTYNRQQCKCSCTNTDDANKCNQSYRIWDSKSCACRCREVTDCTSGSFFDENTCSCAQIIIS